MADFDDEIDEELRRERLRAAWKRYGKYGISLVILVVITAGAYSIYDYTINKERDRLGELLLRGENAEKADQIDNAITAYSYLHENAHGYGYDLLASFRLAYLLGKQGKKDEQIKIYDDIIARDEVSPAWANAARFYRVWAQLDLLDPEQVKEDLSRFFVEDSPYFSLAKQALLLSYLRVQELDKALEIAEELNKKEKEKIGTGGLLDYAALISGGEPVELDRKAIEEIKRVEQEKAEALVRERESNTRRSQEAQRDSSLRLIRQADAQSMQDFFDVFRPQSDKADQP